MAKGIPDEGFVRRNYGRNHAYYLDGKKIDGVTTLLKNGAAKPALINWAGNVTAEYAIDHWDELDGMPPAERLSTLKKARNLERDAAAGRGTEVHDLAERLAHGEEVDVPDAIAGHVESALAFLDDWQVEPVLTETSVVHVGAKYAGTLDMVFRSPLFPGRVFLADWKTNKGGIYPEAALQLTAYARATHYLDGELKPMAGLGITDALGVWVRSDGYSVFPLELSDETWQAFAHVAESARSVGCKEVASAWVGEAVEVHDMKGDDK